MNGIEQIATGFISALGIYLAFGFFFAFFLVTKGLSKVDAFAAQGSWGFKFFILPGLVALWPYLFWRWKKACGSPPLEQSAHRRVSGCGHCGTCPKGKSP